MKTPEEIKKGLEQCANTQTCEKCHYSDDCMELYSNKPLTQDALAYIQQLESRLAQAERERDAAVADVCDMCHRLSECECDGCAYDKRRGVCDQSTKGET